MKKALLVGINAYPPQNRPLRGCVNDVRQMRDILSQHFAFDADNIRQLLDRDATRAELLDQLGWLVADAHAGDVLVFHFSGHGSYVDDDSEDEWECIDEVLVTQDHDWQWPLRDDDVQRAFQHVPKGANLTFICDSCHSGTINKGETLREQARTIFVPLDIQERVTVKVAKRNADYRSFVMDEYRRWAQTMSPSALAPKLEDLLAKSLVRFKENRFQFVRTEENNILLAACQDKQTSADALIDGDWHGAFTYYLVQTILGAGAALTYDELIAKASVGLLSFQQVPQLECPDNLKGQPIFAPF
jgi:hypothetical protein